jgi:6-phosphogluconolactonase (cycloisomerase 2 family)
VCQVTNGAGIAAANVTNVDVTCEADRFAYVAHSSTVSFSGPGLVSALTMNHETGALAPIAGTSTYPIGNGAVQIVSDPRGRFIYIAHTAVFTSQGSVSGFSVNPVTGALTPVPGSPFQAGMATGSLAIDSEGLFLYATNRNSDDISGWVIQANGSLTPVPGSPYRIGDAASPASVATTPAGQCCYVYVAHNNINGVPHVSAYTYHESTGALTQLPGSPFSAGLTAYSPASLQVNTTGELLYMANSGTSNITTFDIAGGAGTLTQRAGSPTPALNSPCYIHQPRLSLSLFVVSSLSYQLGLFGDDLSTFLPTWLDTETMFVGDYCSVATDPYGEFAYVPKFDDVANYLFGFRSASGGSSLEPLPLNPVSPTNTYTLTAQMPRTMVIRYSRRDREILQVPD